MNRLKELRTSKGISMKEMSRELVEKKYFKSIAVSTLNGYENNYRQPNIATWELLADYFNVDPEYLVGWSDVKRKNAQ